MPITSVESAIAAAATKAAVKWVGDQLSSWLSKKNRNKLDEERWTRMCASIIRQTQATCQRYERIVTIAFPSKSVALESLYVPLTLSSTSTGKEYLIKNFPEAMLEKHPRALIVDSAGMGKSTIAKILYLSAMRERKHLPILIDLRRLTEDDTIEIVLEGVFAVEHGDAPLFKELLRNKPILYIFDGFDEVADYAKVNVSRSIRHFIDRSNAAKFVLTSRPEPIFNDYSEFELFRIDRLTKREAHELISRYGSAYEMEDSAKSLIEELEARHAESASSFLENPLLTSLLFRAFEYKSIVPIKRTVFFRQVFDALYEAHDLNKENRYVREKKSGLHQDDFHRALRGISSLFRKKKVVEVKRAEFISMAKLVAGSICADLAFEPGAFLEDVLHAVPLFSMDGDFVRWSHKSLLDYFLSEFLLRDYAQDKGEALKRVAFAAEAVTDENFLALTLESDPILFARSITIPAIHEIIDRYRSITSSAPKGIEEDNIQNIATFFSCHEIFIIPEKYMGGDTWNMLMDDPVSRGRLDVENVFPHTIYSRSGLGFGVMISTRKSFAAIGAPIAVGAIPTISAHSLYGTNARGTFDKPPFEINEINSIFGERPQKKRWPEIEECFEYALGLIVPTTVDLVDIERLSEILESLEASVDKSIEARSADVF